MARLPARAADHLSVLRRNIRQAGPAACVLHTAAGMAIGFLSSAALLFGLAP